MHARLLFELCYRKQTRTKRATTSRRKKTPVVPSEPELTPIDDSQLRDIANVLEHMQQQQEQHVPEFININNNYQEQQELQFNGVLCPLTPIAMDHEQHVTLSDINSFDAPDLIQQQQRIEPRVTRARLTGAIRKRTHTNQQQTPAAKKKKGKQAIPIQYIENSSKRLNTFNKRIKGVGKKLAELSILTGTEIDFSARSPDTGEIFRHCNVLDCTTFRNHITFQEHHKPANFTQITEDKYSEGLANLHKLHAGLRDKRAAGRKKKLTIEQQEREMEKELEKLDENARGIRLMLEKLKTFKYPTTTMLNRDKRYDDANRLTPTQNRRIQQQQQQLNNVIPLILEDQETEEATGSVPQPQQQQSQFYAFSSINRSENQVQQMHHQVADAGDTNTYVGVTDTVTKDGDNIYVHRNIQSSLQLKLSNLNKVTEALQTKRTETQPQQQVMRPISPFPFQPQQHQDVNNNSIYPPFSPMPYSSPFLHFPMTPQTQHQILNTDQQQFARRPSVDITLTPNLSELGLAEWLQTPHAVASFDTLFGGVPN